jgi:VWA domain-containing protein/aerotolerance regulator-like protein
MAFLNPFFLIGVAAAAVPVLVHLVRRTRATKLQFPSLMFLRRIEQKTIRKRKLRNLLLLLLRCAAILLLALAFSRPYFTSANPISGTNRRSTVILLDASYSMRYGDVFERAKQAARNVIGNGTTEDQFAVLLFSNSYEILMPLKADRSEAQNVVGNAQAGLGSTDYLQAIQAADAILKDAGTGERRVVLISDFQDAGWNRAAPPVKITSGVKLVPIDVSDPNPSNTAIVEVTSEPVVYAQKYSSKLIARATSFGSQPPADGVVELKLNDLAVERRPLKLEAGGSEQVEFTGFNVPEGSNRATIEVSGDNFVIDNKHAFTIKREDQTRVLVIESAVRGRSESFFVQQALAAGENNRHQLTIKTAGAVSPADVDSYRVVIVNDPGSIGQSLAAALKSFVERGGGLILAAGKHTEAAEFNKATAGISPAELGDKAVPRTYALMSQIKADHPLLSAFAKGGRLASTRVYGFHRATVHEGAVTIAALDDGSPIVVEGVAGRGKVLLICTTLDTAWNDLPLTPMFLPLTRQMLDYVGGREPASSYSIGQVLVAPPDSDGSKPAIDSPSGGRIDDARTNAQGEQMVDASEAGFYRLRYRDRNEYVAVNLDPKEADLTRLNVDEFVAAVSADGADQGSNPSHSRLSGEEIEGRQRLWLPLLIAALVLFVSEALLARRIRLAKLVG